MRRLGLLVLVLLAFAAPPASAKEDHPTFSAPVVDDADVIPAVVEQRLDDELLAYQRAAGNQIAVAVVDTTGDQSIEDYTFDLFNKEWKVGDKVKDNGVLLVIAVKDRKLRIEVGSGLEGELTDAQSGRIIREQLTPRLRQGDYGGAVEVGVDEIRRALGDTSVGAPPATVAPVADEPSGGFPILPLLIGGFFLFSLLGAGGRRRRNRWGLGGPIIWGGGFGGGLGGGGFGGGGFGGGGFGGGGGGGSSGGGASGGW